MPPVRRNAPIIRAFVSRYDAEGSPLPATADELAEPAPEVNSEEYAPDCQWEQRLHQKGSDPVMFPGDYDEDEAV